MPMVLGSAKYLNQIYRRPQQSVSRYPHRRPETFGIKEGYEAHYPL